jgi:hypothetical protein
VGYVVVPSSRPTAPQRPGPPGPAAVTVQADQVKTLLAALDEAAELRGRAETCAYCADQSCTTCQLRLQAADAYDKVAGEMIQAAEAAARQRAPDHPAPDASGPPAAADREAGQ